MNPLAMGQALQTAIGLAPRSPGKMAAQREILAALEKALEGRGAP